MILRHYSLYVLAMNVSGDMYEFIVITLFCLQFS